MLLLDLSILTRIHSGPGNRTMENDNLSVYFTRSLKIGGFTVSPQTQTLNLPFCTTVFRLFILVQATSWSKMDAADPDKMFSYQYPNQEERKYNIQRKALIFLICQNWVMGSILTNCKRYWGKRFWNRYWIHHDWLRSTLGLGIIRVL